MSDNLFDDPEVCQAVLMDYYRNPRCAGICQDPTHTAEGRNPACGDIVKLSFRIEDGRILEARTTGAGCAVSQAAASLLVERLQGTTLEEASGILAAMNHLLTQAGEPGTVKGSESRGGAEATDRAKGTEEANRAKGTDGVHRTKGTNEAQGMDRAQGTDGTQETLGAEGSEVDDGKDRLEHLGALKLIIHNPARVRCAQVARETALEALGGIGC